MGSGSTELKAEYKDKEQESGSKNRYIVLVLVLTGVLMAVLDGSVVASPCPP